MLDHTQPLRQINPSEAQRVDGSHRAQARAYVPSGRAALMWRDGNATNLQTLTGVTRIGRSLQAVIRFEDPSVSRRHALIVPGAHGDWILRDDRSLNGVYVNGKRVAEHVLQADDEIGIGRHRLVFAEAVMMERRAPALAIA